jgi:hypothetical protein
MSEDFKTGPVVDKPKPAYTRPQREPEMYKGEPPQYGPDNKTPQVFPLQRTCGIEEIDQKTKKKIKCQMKLQVIRVKNQVFERDESGYGGQLIYDERDIRQYVTCPIHGGLPPLYDRWERA